jgi:hypothetical protein
MQLAKQMMREALAKSRKWPRAWATTEATFNPAFTRTTGCPPATRRNGATVVGET